MAIGNKSKTNTEDNKSKTEKPAQKSFWNFLHKMINKAFRILREIAKLLWTLIENAARLTVFCFSLLVNLASSPTTPCIVAIFCFGAVCAIAASQWYQIGFWLGRLLGVSSAWGIGAGTAGVLLGVGLNIYQLAPQLWKLRKDIAEAYKALEINPEFQAQSTENVNDRLNNWLSMDHGTLKGIRLATYSIETALVCSYCFLAAGLNFFAIVQAAISLILPEKCLELVSSTIAVLGGVSDKVNGVPEDNATF
jgi:hypothetical protein